MAPTDPARARLALPLAVGLAGCAATVALALAPLALLDAGWAAMAPYWSAGLGGLWVVAALAAALAVVFLAALRGRADAPLATGVALGAGCVLAAVAVVWAVLVDAGLVGELSPAAWFRAHRWLVVAAAAVPAAASAWAAARAGLLAGPAPGS